MTEDQRNRMMLEVFRQTAQGAWADMGEAGKAIRASRAELDSATDFYWRTVDIWHRAESKLREAEAEWKKEHPESEAA